jgi:GTP cyclohydrolase I
MNIEKIADLFAQIMKEFNLDLTDDSLRDTPKRMAKMYVNELFWGLDKTKIPAIMVQENKFNYDQMLIESNITVNSTCEHHFVPFIGYAHIAYIPNRKIIGLSKLNRIVDYFSHRPQVQEKLTSEIMEFLQEKLDTQNIAIVIDAVHLCVRIRGVKHQNSVTRTSKLSGVFFENQVRSEFFNSIPSISDFRL